MRIILFLITFNCHAQLLYEQDKQQHFIAGTVFSAPTYSEVYLKTGDIGKAFSYGLLASTLVGTGKELIDDRFDERDLMATMLGAIAVNSVLTIYVVINKKHKKTRLKIQR